MRIIEAIRRFLAFVGVAGWMMIVPVCGFRKLHTGPDAAVEYAREHPMIVLFLKRDAISQPPWNTQHITMRSNAHLGLVLVNDTFEPTEILWNGRGLRCIRCTLHNEQGCVPWPGIPDLLPPRVPEEVFSLPVGSRVIQQEILSPWYGLSWLKPGDYMLQITVAQDILATDPFTGQSAKLTPLALEKWVSIELIR